jgi:hypothetical protein
MPQNTTALSAVLIPHESWTCGMADSIPSPESGTLIFEAEMKFERILDVGRTPYGKRPMRRSSLTRLQYDEF